MRSRSLQTLAAILPVVALIVAAAEGQSVGTSLRGLEKVISDPADLPAALTGLRPVSSNQVQTAGSTMSIRIPAELLPTAQMRFNLITYKSSGGAADSVVGGKWSPSRTTVLKDRVDGAVKSSLDLLEVTVSKRGADGTITLSVTTRGPIVEPGSSMRLLINPADANPGDLYLFQSTTATAAKPAWDTLFLAGSLRWPAPAQIHEIRRASLKQVAADSLEVSVVIGTTVPANLPAGIARPNFQFSFAPFNTRAVLLTHDGTRWVAQLVNVTERSPGLGIDYHYEVIRALPVIASGNKVGTVVKPSEVVGDFGLRWFVESRPQIGPPGAAFWSLSTGNSGRVDIAPDNGGFVVE